MAGRQIAVIGISTTISAVHEVLSADACPDFPAQYGIRGNLLHC